MPRLSAETIHQREEFIRNFFKGHSSLITDPKNAILKAQQAIKGATGMAMSLTRIHEILAEGVARPPSVQAKPPPTVDQTDSLKKLILEQKVKIDSLNEEIASLNLAINLLKKDSRVIPGRINIINVEVADIPNQVLSGALEMMK